MPDVGPYVTRSKSRVASAELRGGQWWDRLAAEIDGAVAELSGDRDVLSVAITPILGEHASQDATRGTMEWTREPVLTCMSSVIVTVVWRERAADGGVSE